MFNLTSIINSIDFDLIASVYQIKNYRTLIKFSLSQTASENILVLIDSITSRYSRLSQSQFVVSRNTQRSKSIESLIFFENWVIDRSQLLSNIKKFYNNCINYRISSDYLIFKDQIHDDLISVFSENSSDFVDIISNKFSLKSRLLRASKFERFISIDSLLLIKFSDLKQKSSSATFIMSRSTVEPFNASEAESFNASDNTTTESNDDTSFIVSRKEWKTMLKFMQTMQAVLQTNVTTIETKQRSEGAAFSNNDNTRWNAEELKFFDSMYDNKSINTEQVMKHVEKNTYFRDVHLFIDRAKNMTVIHDEQFVRENLFICLRDTTFQWYISKISTEIKEFFRYEQELRYWTKQLLKKFKESADVFMITILRERYIMKNARRRRESREYASIILRATKSTELKFHVNQIAIIYNELDPEFQRNLIKSENVSSLNTFLREMNDFKHIWWALTAKNKSSSQTTYDRYQSNNNYNQSAGRLMNESTNNRNYRYENQYYQNQFTERYRENSDNYNPRDEYAIYSPNRQSQSLYSNQFYQKHNYSNRNQSQTYALAFASHQDSSYQSENPYQYDKEKQNASSFSAQKSSQTSSLTQSYLQRVFSKSTNNSEIKQKAYYTSKNDESWKNEDQENVYSEQYFENDRKECHEDYVQNNESLAKENDDISQNFFVNALTRFNVSYNCRKCEHNFSSKNALHRHFKECFLKDSAKLSTAASTIVFFDFVISDFSSLNINIKTWHFLTIKASIDLKFTLNDLCINTDCETFMTNRIYVTTMLSNFMFKVKVTASLRVKNIDNVVVFSTESIILNFSFSETFDEKSAIVKFAREIRLMNNLSVKIFIKMNIIEFECMTINASTLIIDSCKNLKVEFFSISKDASIKRIIICSSATTIFSHSTVKIFIKLREKKGLFNRDYMFHSKRMTRLDNEDEIFSHIVNSNFSEALIINNSNNSITIFRRSRLDVVKEFDDERCYMMFSKNAHLTVDNWNSSKLKVKAMLAAVLSESTEIVTSFDITIYETKSAQHLIKEIVEFYFSIWSNDAENIVNISKEDWMSVNLLSKTKISQVKVYSVGSKNKQLIDEIFDKLHAQRRMKYSKYSISHEYSIFVTWRTILKSEQESIRKKRVVVDIRGLNKIIETNNYSMSLQSDITFAVAGCEYISVFDVASFFYQWNVRLKNRHKLTMISHRDQKQFNVAIMRFKESSIYVQRQIDVILRKHKDYSKVFINDIVVYSKTLENHIKHLHAIFSLLKSFNISFSSEKSFLDYSSMQLLKQKVDAFDLTTVSKKIEAIVKLEFLRNLKDLETYLDFIEWLRHYISYYAQKSNSLQIRKTNLLRLIFSNKDAFRKAYSARVDLTNIIDFERNFYEQLQKTFNRQKFLFHFDSIKTLYANIDASKSYEFEVMIYHISNSSQCDDSNKISRLNVQFILFLSKMLTKAEKRYWSTELEIAALVWVIRKIRHMIEATIKIIVIFTNHSANTFIARQTSLTFSNIDKLNLKLIRIFAYLSQFDLDVRYKSEKTNIVSDALSKLSTKKIIESFSDCFLTKIFQISLMIMSDVFKKRLVAEYAANAWWVKIMKVIKNLKKRLKREKNIRFEDRSRYESKIHIDLNFIMRDDLIYHKKRQRLCISASLDKEIFMLTHDKNQHFGVNRCYARISENLYIPHLSKKLRQYVSHCSNCQLNQIKKHRSYEKLLSISTSTTLFHTIFMNFVMSISNNMNTLLIIICKFSKRVIILADKAIFSTEKWADLVLKRLQTTNWDISAAIISNRNSKFLFEFWRALFKKLKVVLLTSIAYHAQANEQSERTNQTIEIAIRYLIIANIDVLFFLSSFQSQLNNFSNASIDLSSNEIIYEFRVREALFMKVSTSIEDISKNRLKNRQKTADAISFVNAHMKIRYDVKHKSLLLQSEDKVYLRLHKSYEIANQHKKLDNQRCESFLVKRRVDRFAYELNISLRWRIHFVVSVAQFESTSFLQNSYNRSRSDHFNSVYVEDDTETKKSYEVERIIDKRIKKFDRTSITQYKIKWKEYDFEFDEWKSISKLDDCMNLIEDYEKQLDSDIQRERWKHFKKTSICYVHFMMTFTHTLASLLHFSIR